MRASTNRRTWGLRAMLCLVWLAAAPPARPQVVINEFVAVNNSTLADEDDAHPDWLELYNRGPAAVDLGGWYLTDRLTQPTKWEIPSFSLPPGGYRVIFASGKNRRDPAGVLHASFQLSGSGEYLALVRPDGATIEHAYAPAFPPQESDISYGLTAGTSSQVVVLAEGAPCRARVPLDDSLGDSWHDTAFDDSAWLSGVVGVGYDVHGDYDPWIGLDVETVMRGQSPSVYVRVPFVVSDPSQFATLELGMRSDDGFRAWLNGQAIASTNVPETLAWDSLAVENPPDSVSVQRRTYPVAGAAALLTPGTNVLAVHGVNFSLSSTDCLIHPDLSATAISTNQSGLLRYFRTPSPGSPNLNEFVDFVADTKFSVDRGWFTNAFQVAITSATPDAVIRYTLDGSAPTESTGLVYSNALTVSNTTILRAAAFKTGHEPTDVDTQTYLFLDDIIAQPSLPAGFPASWGSRNADYEMDPEIVGDATYGPQLAAALTGLPTVSVALPVPDLFDGAVGIYANPRSEGTAWEKACSVELLHPDGADGFQVNAGIQIMGGASRSTSSNYKYSFRLVFKGVYGPTRLRHPFFGESAQQAIDTIVLRGGYNDAWPTGGSALAGKYIYLRDEYMRGSQLALGHQPAARGRWVHLYLNGLYWGVYDATERPDASFQAEYLGGEKEEYDVIKHINPELQSGTWDAWNAMYAMAQGGLATPSAYTAFQELVDVDSLIDYMMLGFWAGSRDWLPNNWYGARRRTPDGRWRFYLWDMEFSLRDYGEWSHGGPSRSSYLDRADDSRDSPAGLYAALRANEEFRLLFADRFYRHFYHDGPMTPSNTLARMQEQVDTVEIPLIAESARWGDALRSTPYTIDDPFRPVVAALTNSYLPGRRETFLADLRGGGTQLDPLFPAIDPPVFEPYGGVFSDPVAVHATAAAGTVYYTVDGSDPRLPGGGVSPTAVAFAPTVTALVTTHDPIRIHVPRDDGLGEAWRLPVFDDSAWLTGSMPIGFDRGTSAPMRVHLPLDETTGTVALDATGQGRDGTYGGVPTLGQPGARPHTGTSVSFDRVDDHVDLSPHLDDFRDRASGTLTAWFRNPAPSGAFAILTASDSRDSSHELRLFVETGALRYNVRGDRGSTAQLVSAAGVNDGAWHFAAVTVDEASYATLYLDGVPAAAGTRPFFSSVDDLDWMGLGRNVDSGGPQWHFLGEIDDVRVFDEVLEAGQIADLYAGGGGAGAGFAGLVDPELADPLADSMIGSNASAFVRIPFVSPGGPALEQLALRARVDDGVSVHLNGTPVAAINAAASPAWNAAATTDRSPSQALVPEPVDLSASLAALVPAGQTNLLAIQIQNHAPTSPDLLLGVGLSGSSGSIPVSRNTQFKARVLAGGTWSALNQALFVFDQPATLGISECMVAPHAPTGIETQKTSSAESFEFIELTNDGPAPLGLAGLAFTEGISFDFTGSGVTALGPGERVLIVPSIPAFTSRYPQVEQALIAGEYDGNLANQGERITLQDAAGRILFTFAYDANRAWPLAAAGAGHSLVPRSGVDPSAEALNYAGNWRASAYRGGSPGAADPEPPRDVLLNEIDSHTDLSDTNYPGYDSNDWIELYNASSSRVILADWYLSDDADNLKKWSIPVTAFVASGGWTVFDEITGFHQPLTNGFGISKAGEPVFLSYLPGGASDRVADAIRFKAQANETTWGRYPDGGPYWTTMSPTPGSANGVPVPHVLIAEVMAQPVSTNILHEYIALHNPLPSAQTLDGPDGPWRIDGSTAYTFAPGTTLSADGHLLLVGFDPSNAVLRADFLGAYGLAEGQVPMQGPFVGSLPDVTGRIALERPLAPDDPGDSIAWIVVDEVVYARLAPWTAAVAGSGLALHRVDPSGIGSDPHAWLAAFPSPADGLVAEHRPGLDLGRVPPDVLLLQWKALPNLTYRVEVAGDPNAPWTPLVTVTNPADIPVTEIAPPAADARFYRVLRRW